MTLCMSMEEGKKYTRKPSFEYFNEVIMHHNKNASISVIIEYDNFIDTTLEY